MAIQRYDQNSLLQRFQNEINQMFDRDWNERSDMAALSTAQWLPAVDVEETQDSYTILADVPGMKADEIDVMFENGILTVKGERTSERSVEDNRTRRSERSFGTFVRRFSLPDAANADDIDARIDNGVLSLTIKKRAESQPRKITVQG